MADGIGLVDHADAAPGDGVRVLHDPGDTHVGADVGVDRGLVLRVPAQYTADVGVQALGVLADDDAVDGPGPFVAQRTEVLVE